MTRYNHLPIFQLAYNLTLEIHKTTHHFSREYKYTLGQKLKEIAVDFLDCIILANSEENKIIPLDKAKSLFEKLKINTRLAYDLKAINFRKYEIFFRSFQDLGKQLSGWRSWAEKKKNNGEF
jgi:hypothetical protein